MPGTALSSALVTALMTALAIAPGLAYAQIYSCKDSAGRTLTSDREIPECAARDMREIGKNGVFRRVIPAPLTAEQRHQKQIDDERQKQMAEAMLEMRRRDQAILARFRNESDIELAHKRATNDLQEKMRQSDRALLIASMQLSNTEAEMARRDNKKAMPAYLEQRAAEAKTGIAVENIHMRQYQAELSQLDSSFDETLKRFRELTAMSAAK